MVVVVVTAGLFNPAQAASCGQEMDQQLQQLKDKAAGEQLDASGNMGPNAQAYLQAIQQAVDENGIRCNFSSTFGIQGNYNQMNADSQDSEPALTKSTTGDPTGTETAVTPDNTNYIDPKSDDEY